MSIDLHKIENLGLEVVLRRGTADILEQDETGLFLYDTVSKAYMITCEDKEKAKEWILKHADKNYGTIAIVGKEITDFVMSKFAFPHVLTCHQLGYLGPKVSLPETEMKVRTADLSDLSFVLGNYDQLSEEDITTIVKNGKLLIGEVSGAPVGFIGEHLEGSMGLLFILPEYRRRGFAEYFEKYLLNHVIDAGNIPFGQVVLGNEKSMNLQKKLGMTEGDELVYWLY